MLSQVSIPYRLTKNRISLVFYVISITVSIPYRLTKNIDDPVKNAEEARRFQSLIG